MIEKFAERHVVWFCFALFAAVMPTAWGLLYLLHLPPQGDWAGVIRYSVSAALTLLLMYLIWHKTLFSFRCVRFFQSLFTFGLLGVIGALGAFVFSSGAVDRKPAFTAVLGCVLVSFAIAVCEEFLFRAVMLNAMIRAWNGRKNFPVLAVIASSAIFGLRHFLNLIFFPHQVIMTCAQVIFCFMSGIYLGAVYLRSRNIWVCVAIHFLEDFAASVWVLFSSAAAASASADASFLSAALMIAMQIPYVIFAWLMLRDKRWSYEA